MRLLFGRETISRASHVIDIDAQENGSSPSESSVTKEIEELDINERSADLIDNLIQFLNLKDVEVRTNSEKFNHAKCYIFDEVVGIGSSNFTGAGLAGNVELNAILYQPSYQKPVQEWFDKRWDKAEPSKQKLIEVLEESKFGSPLSPYLLYMKFLYEYYKPRLEELKSERGKVIELTSFQQDALNSALRILAKYDGVLISDSTGLGKTHIGIELLREYVAVKRKHAIVVAPAQVLHTVWQPKLQSESIKAREITLESTGTSSFHADELLDYDVVLIDESHNYRNASTNRRQNLMKLIGGGRKKKVILLTATPVNNSLLDLYYQLSMITAGDDAHFLDLGIPDLKRHFVSAERKDLAVGIEDITRLLDEIMIRRTRQFIIENYKNAELNGKPVRFPTRLPPEKVEYSLTELFGGAVYRQVLDCIEALHMVPYRVDSYRLTVEEKDKFEVEHRAALQKFGLLKRFESSVEAIRKSVDRLVNFYNFFDKALREGKILTSIQFHKIMSDLEEKEIDVDENEEEVFKALENATLDSITKEYDARQIRQDLKEDLALLEPLQKNLEKMKPFADRKLRALEERLLKDNAFETGGRKVVIFTQYVDTAKYLEKELRSTFGEQEIRILTGETKKHDREQILREFAPIANNPEKIYVAKQSDLLISTDVLSEGQNLQDCNYVVNYDLPWNPMKIVQRVGRVDRLGSDFDTVTSVVFIPEKELEDLLNLLERLAERIRKVALTVGTEATILGEQENPRNFNAISRIVKGKDASLMDDLQRAQDVLPAETPFNSIVSYMRKIGTINLEGIPLGKRSGKYVGDCNGVVIFYREKKNPEGVHIIFFNFKTGKFEPYNEMGWFWKRIQCEEEEPLMIPLDSRDAYRQFKAIDHKAREEVLIQLNKPFDAESAQKLKPKNQRELANLLQEGFNDGRISKEETLTIFRLLRQHNLGAWDEDFEDILRDYKRQQNMKAVLTSLEQLFQRFKIEVRERRRPKPLETSDLEIVCYTFLSNNVFKDLQLLP